MASWIERAASSVGNLATAAKSAGEEVKRTQDLAEQYVQKDPLTRIEERTQRHVDKMDMAFNQLEGYFEQYGQSAGLWTKELQMQLDLLKVGGIELDDFLKKWGQVVVSTADGDKRIRELFKGLDLKGKTREIAEFTNSLNTGRADIEDALTVLSEISGQYASQLREIVQAVRDGQLPLSELKAKIKQIEAIAPNSDFGDLGEAIYKSVLRGQK